MLEHELMDDTGLSLARRIRNHETELPVIVVTNDGDEEICTTYFRIGVDDYMKKLKLDTDLLQDRLENVITQRENHPGQ